MPVKPESPSSTATARTLPGRISIPTIRGEMVHLRPATLADLPLLDELEAFHNASTITGKDPASERLAVRAWVRRSVAWVNGKASSDTGGGDPESRRTVAWAIQTDSDHDGDGQSDATSTGNVIGMVFLIDIDGWGRSARIQVILGKDYRGRGYSRDAMPRVMTYGFASEPVGLGLHRIWVAVPEKNARSLSVYQSLGFVPSGTSRDALWDAENDKYQDLIVMDSLVDEYDPIQSLDAFGMHVIEENPGVREALAAREHSLALRQKLADSQELQANRQNSKENQAVGAPGSTAGQVAGGTASSAGPAIAPEQVADPQSAPSPDQQQPAALASQPAQQDDGSDARWLTPESRKPSKAAWWRNLGRKHKDAHEDENSAEQKGK
ncbi:GNAT family N-acetyltransferase [Bifidobacterium aemilianum]|uniref:GNAT family N-acetyltransferase n=1 Tax=Bifidobacterium aemilianum TaxID=2493120 RepID=A0A366K7H7_9BIFI|nr:GNAT family protein [Bifidobacterium aemilianum]RBP97695.1 GNAT family N-acetyltransferase [Bifidobacterium aemilianum]